jgi:hypothetical protein
MTWDRGVTLERGVWLLSLALSACGGDDEGASGGTGGEGGTGGAQLPGTGGSGGTVATTGGATGSGGTVGSGGTAGAGTGGAAGGTGGQPPLPGCSADLAPQRANDVVDVSAEVLDYPLIGPPGDDHYDILMVLFDASSLDASSPDSLVGVRDFYTPRQLGDTFFNDPNGVHAFLNEASYGKLSIAGRIVGWIDLGPQTTPSE